MNVRPGRLHSRSGFTFFEIIVASVMVAILIIAMGKLIDPIQKSFLQSRLRNQATAQARDCMDTIVRLLRLANANSVSLCTCTDAGNACGTCTAPSTTTSSIAPSSQIEFTTAGDGHAYRIWWQSDGTVRLNDGTHTNQVLARNVVTMSFAPEGADTVVILVTLQMSVPVNGTGTQREVLALNSQSVRLVTTQ